VIDALGLQIDVLGGPIDRLATAIDALGVAIDRLGVPSEPLGARDDTLGERSHPLAVQSDSLVEARMSVGIPMHLATYFHRVDRRGSCDGPCTKGVDRYGKSGDLWTERVAP